MNSDSIFSLVAICISFIGVVSSFIFSYKKADRERDQERELNIKTMTTMNDNIRSIDSNISKIDRKVESIDNIVTNLDKKIVKHDTEIENLKKEVYKARRGN